MNIEHDFELNLNDKQIFKVNKIEASLMAR